MSKVDFDDLKKASAEIADNLMNKQTSFDNIEEVVDQQFQLPKQVKQIRRVNFPIPKVPSDVPAPVQPLPNNTTSDFIALGSLNVPKPTLFLAVVLLAIGVALWFMTNKSKNKQDKKQNQEDK